MKRSGRRSERAAVVRQERDDELQASAQEQGSSPALEAFEEDSRTYPIGLEDIVEERELLSDGEILQQYDF